MPVQQTSIDAYRSLNLPPRQMAVLEVLLRGGFTDFEVAERLRLPINCITGRRNELVSKGLVRDTGSRRKNRYSEHLAIVWAAARREAA